MNFYDASVYFLMISLCIGIVASLRVASRRGATSALAGLSGVTITAATGLVVLGELMPIDYTSDIALYLLVLGPIGTIIVAKILMGGGFK
ncbi:MAG: hypothetical protein JW825_05025 [Candidatus Methanofastidiosa archaeon]|nr:hypothetical protein [Candidatus Methanofastidiosa archaeon]